MESKIDFVVTWVDGGDPNWIKKKNEYVKGGIASELNSESRYRDFDIFKYWFRSVEKYAPWVNKIFLITDRQIPEWLNKDHPKLELVDHRDYIEEDFLPTFNSNVIELNIHRIKNLSENFILFNDDTFFNSYADKNDFFKGNTPKDVYVESPIMATKNSIDHTLVNNVEIINEQFDKRNFYRQNFAKIFNPKVGKKIVRTIALLPSSKFSGFWNSHLPVAYNKETFKQVWKLYGKELKETSANKFRTAYDVNHWLMRYWQLVSGNYEVQKPMGKVFDMNNNNLSEVLESLENDKFKLICINDNDELEDYEIVKQKLQEKFEKKFNKKSKFEL
ncbi:Stealth CR1 domain-containing protein [Pediococcus pentosaceus]|uniref:Stealth CR1 domain-containing protein n=1 Tax=Pediococcus pentosaceus TaxID=1255 RepID=UPI0020171AD1|nr:Stealth CR1 domain-containing protein [Pediococcus pentosaceus]MCL3858251.1 Stealth CR1 domain-containing protein [Pediococcus pentosaceus]